jgi:hypothetical protein
MFVEACRLKSAFVGVGWGQDWGQGSKSNLRLPVHGDVVSDHHGRHGIAGYVHKFLVGETLSDTRPLAGTPADV